MVRIWLTAIAGSAAAVLLVAAGTGTEPQAASALPGAAVYEANCAACHDGAQEQTPSKAVLRSKSAAAILQALTTGVMQSMAAHLSTAEKGAVAAYLAAAGEKTGAVRMSEPDPAANMCKEKQGRFALRPDDWNGWSPDLANSRFHAKAGLTAVQVPGLKPVWAFAYPGGRASGPPTVAGGRVFIGSSSGRVASLDAATGCTHWITEPASGIKSSILVGRIETRDGPRHLAFYGDGYGVVHALNAETGARLWQVRADPSLNVGITGSVKLHDGTLYVPTMTANEGGKAKNAKFSCCRVRGSVVALDAATGDLRWRSYTIQETPRPFKVNAAGTQMYGPAGASVWSAPTLDPARGTVYVTTGQSRTDVPEDASDAVIAMNLVDGRRRWAMQAQARDVWLSGCEPPNPHPNCPAVLGPDVDFGSPPILSSIAGKPMLFAAQKSGRVHALVADTGKPVWRTELSQFATLPKGKVLRDRDHPGVVFGMGTDGKRLYAAVADPYRKAGYRPVGVVAMDLATGRILWRAAGEPVPSCAWGATGCTGAQRTAVTVIPGVVFAGAANGKIYAYDSNTGAKVWSFDTARRFDAVNGVAAQGGAVEGSAAIVAGGRLFVMSGYGSYGGGEGNALLAFAPGR